MKKERGNYLNQVTVYNDKFFKIAQQHIDSLSDQGTSLVRTESVSSETGSIVETEAS